MIFMKPIYKPQKPYTEDINDLVEKGGPGSGIKGHLTYHPESFEHHRLMAGHHETKAKKHSDAASDFKSSSDKGLHETAKPHEEKADHHAKLSEQHLKQAKSKHKPDIHGPWNSTIPSEKDSSSYGERHEETPKSSYLEGMANAHGQMAQTLKQMNKPKKK